MYTQKQIDQIINGIVQLSDSVRGAGLQRQAGLSSVPAPELEQWFEQTFDGPNGLKRIAYAFKEPLKIVMDYQGVGRRILKVDDMPVGEIPAYDKDIPEFAAVRMAQRGAPPQVEWELERLAIPTTKIMVNDKVDYEEIQIRRYPVFDRAKERTGIAIAIAEDREIFQLLETAALVGPNDSIDIGTDPFSKTAFAEAFGIITGNQLAAGAILMHPKDYADILTWNSTDLDQVTLNEIISTGAAGSIWNMPFIVSTKMPIGVAYAVTTPDKLGRIPERKPVELKIFDYVPKAHYAFMAWEQVGFGCHNTQGVVKIYRSA